MDIIFSCNSMKTSYGVMIRLNDNHLLSIYIYLVLCEQCLTETSKWLCEGGFSKCILQTRKSRLKDFSYQDQCPIDEMADYGLSLVLMTPSLVLFSR